MGIGWMKGLSALGLALAATLGVADAAPKGARWGEKYFPNYRVVDQHGKAYNFYKDLIENKIVAVNFVYTNCPDICGLQSARMSIVQDQLGDRLGRDLFIYSISLDPVRDTPEALKAYATAFGVRPGWLFLTGDPKQLHEIRYKLGERSRSLAEHRNDIVLGNDRTGEWGRSSMMANLKQLTRSIIDMDPRERDKSRGVPRRRTAKAISMKRVS
ncbi:MAG: SCO family protein, partial [Hyphomicrobiaceae bacterium]